MGIGCVAKSYFGSVLLVLEDNIAKIKNTGDKNILALFQHHHKQPSSLFPRYVKKALLWTKLVNRCLTF